jgi:uncharacterized SAM-binding protein YcdF (DUF218 family)
MELSPLLFGFYKLAKFALYPLSWLIGLLGLLTALALAPPSPRLHRWIRRLAVLALVLTLLLANHRVAGTLLGLIEAQAPPFEPSPSERFDAIVVLAGGVYPKGTLRPTDQLSYFSLVRTICGADLYARGLAPKVVLSGGDATVFGRGPAEAHEMRRLALRLGVPNEAILIEDRSRTTYENAVETKRLLGPASVLLATSALHIPRAQALFRGQGLAVTAYPCSYSARHHPGELSEFTIFDLIPTADGLRGTTVALNELAGLLVYRLAGKL